jgi:UTP-glucose-1-phosphate uridylyltransferase
MKKTTLLIMAAGLGSRYGGNKQVDGIGPHGEILMQYSIYDAIRAGFDRLVFVIKKEHQDIIERFCKDIKGVEIAFVYQDFSSIPSFYKIPAERVKPFGTVHAVLCARDAIKEPFAVINADDFYGRDAFVVMHEKLQTLKEKEATMVAYYLKNTVSKNGAVTRGVCELSDGKLTSVTETYKITVAANGDIVDADNGKLDPSALVSMNMWGFMPDIFGDMQTYFENFLKAIPDGEIKAEYALPTMVDSMLGKDLEVYVLSTTATWFGVTYIEDKPEVAAELVKKHESGEYPEILFQ